MSEALESTLSISELLSHSWLECEDHDNRE